MSTAGMTAEEFANLSDEEIMNMASAPAMAAPQTAAEEEGQEDEDEGAEGAGTGSEPPGSPPGSDDPAGDDGDAEDEPEGAQRNPLADPDEPAGAPADPKAAAKPQGEAPDAGTPKAGEKAADPVEPQAAIDYKASYEKIMAPFKANGKMIELKSPDEAVQLMQMGANYTQKMQALQPNLKLLRMLENNDLLDTTKLSYLIDLNRRDPEAIKKLVKDSGLDPLEIDTSKDPDYKPGNHTVTDSEISFTEALKDAKSTEHGKKLIIDIDRTWDAASKNRLWEDPAILSELTRQRENGVYDRIVAEVDRRKILGKIPHTMPFLQAYHDVGHELTAQGAFTQAPQAPSSTPPGNEPSQVLETRTAKQKQVVSNGDKAKAAMITKTVPKKTVTDFNPLAMSDEDFEKAVAAGKLV